MKCPVGYSFLEKIESGYHAVLYFFVFNGNKPDCYTFSCFRLYVNARIHSHLKEIDRIIAAENQIYQEEEMEEQGENIRIIPE